LMSTSSLIFFIGFVVWVGYILFILEVRGERIDNFSYSHLIF